MPNPYKKLPPGSAVTQFSLTAWNDMLDMLHWWQLQRRIGAGLIRHTDQATIVSVKNASEIDDVPQALERFSVLGIDGPLFGPDVALEEFKNRVILKGVTPVEPDHHSKFVVLLQPLQSDEVGMACIAGVCPAKLTVASAGHKFADITDGDPETLTTAPTGAAQILWSDEDQWAVVRIGAGGGYPRMIHGLAYGAVTSTDATFYIDNVAAVYGVSPVTSASETVPISNVHGFDIDDNGRVAAVYCEEDDVWEAIQATCPV